MSAPGLRSVWALLASLTLAACAASPPRTTSSDLRAEVPRGTAAPPATGPLPWPAPEQSAAQIEHAGLKELDEEGSALHFHTHLDVFVDGEAVTVPELGLDCCVSPLHTHSESGILHVESPDKNATYTLGNVFGLWGVRLSDSCVGGYCVPEYPIRVLVDGEEAATSPPEVRLTPGAEIAIVIGQPPDTIPDHYDCDTAATIEAKSCEASFR